MPVGAAVIANVCAPVPLQSQISRRVPLAVAPPGESMHRPDCGFFRVPLAWATQFWAPVPLQSQSWSRAPLAVPPLVTSRHRPRVVRAVPLQVQCWSAEVVWQSQSAIAVPLTPVSSPLTSTHLPAGPMIVLPVMAAEAEAVGKMAIPMAATTLTSVVMNRILRVRGCVLMCLPVRRGRDRLDAARHATRCETLRDDRRR